MENLIASLWAARFQIAQGLVTTAEVSAAPIALGTILGLAVGIGLSYGPRPLRWLMHFYVDVVRGTPVLVLVLASFYVLAFLGLHLGAKASGILALTVFCGAHLGEVTRGALAAIPAGQVEAARSLGLGFGRILALVLVPQAVRFALPVWVNTAVEIVKASTLLSVIGVGELLLKTQEVIGRTFLTLEFYLLAGLLYFAINYSIQALGQRAERRLAIPGL